jgi:hypothetical protein
MQLFWGLARLFQCADEPSQSPVELALAIRQGPLRGITGALRGVAVSAGRYHVPENCTPALLSGNDVVDCVPLAAAIGAAVMEFAKSVFPLGKRNRGIGRRFRILALHHEQLEKPQLESGEPLLSIFRGSPLSFQANSTMRACPFVEEIPNLTIFPGRCSFFSWVKAIPKRRQWRITQQYDPAKFASAQRPSPRRCLCNAAFAKHPVVCSVFAQQKRTKASRKRHHFRPQEYIEASGAAVVSVKWSVERQTHDSVKIREYIGTLTRPQVNSWVFQKIASKGLILKTLVAMKNQR